MNNGGIVALNIFVKDEIINDGGIPILFYWNFENDLIGELKENEALQSFIKKNVKAKDFGDTSISGIYFNNNFTEDSDDDEYKTFASSLQSMYNIETFNYDLDILHEIFTALYLTSFKQIYGGNLTKEDGILDIIRKLKEKYPSRISYTVLRNYIQTQLRDTFDNLTEENKSQVINKFDSLTKK
jgi:hypothetical protein